MSLERSSDHDHSYDDEEEEDIEDDHEDDQGVDEAAAAFNKSEFKARSKGQSKEEFKTPFPKLPPWGPFTNTIETEGTEQPRAQIRLQTLQQSLSKGRTQVASTPLS